ncbi:MAG TPA: metallophosphoesterase [Verrucomicrobiae bacterium]|nr:metallophosphoesterase [Verrucomicrobiae bacterium]
MKPKMLLPLRAGAGEAVRGLSRNFRFSVRAGLVLFLLVLLTSSSTIASSGKARELVVAVGDVHGAFDSFQLILRHTRLADTEDHWIGGSATLVQTGDLIDRGPQGREAMDLLMRLEKEASTAGGQVVPLLGNHEVMNILGDLRYVTPANYAAFADGNSEKLRKAAYQEYAAWAADHAKWLAAIRQPAMPSTEEEWMAAHPAGFVEYREAFSPDGKYGQWVRQHVAVVQIGGVIFVHGGIPPNLTSLSLEQINSQVRQEIDEFDSTMRDLVSRKVILPFFTIKEIVVAVQGQLLEEHTAQTPTDPEFHNRLVRLLDFNNWLCMRDEGPLWFRGYDSWSEEEGEPQIQKILAACNASHIVVAHTVQKPANIRSRYGARVFLIDTGMLSTYWPGGRASALNIQKDGKITAEYIDGQQVLFEEKHPASAGNLN